MKRVGDDYQYIRLNQAAQALLSNNAIGKMLSAVTSSRNFVIIQENYHRAILQHGVITSIMPMLNRKCENMRHLSARLKTEMNTIF
ncbi:hypothetical protein LSPH24S_01821 [Lysinibacillus sphaericus]